MNKSFVENSGQMAPPSIPAASGLQPAFVRLPRAGEREPFSGLTRSALFSLIKTGRVKSHSLKTPGTKRGIRLIDAASLREAIEGSAA